MKPISWVGLVLLIAGIVILSGKISYTSDSESVAVGPVELVTKRKSAIPPAVGGILLIGGVALLIMGARKR